MPMCVSPLQNGGMPTEGRQFNWQGSIIFVKSYLSNLKHSLGPTHLSNNFF